MKKEIRIEIGQKIASLRKEKGYSQVKLAELVDMAPGNIARIELGKYSTGIDIIDKILSALDCRLEFSSLLISIDQAGILYDLGLREESYISFEEPTYLLQTDSPGWTPSPNRKINIITVDLALEWLQKKFGEEVNEAKEYIQLMENQANLKLTKSQQLDVILKILS